MIDVHANPKYRTHEMPSLYGDKAGQQSARLMPC